MELKKKKEKTKNTEKVESTKNKKSSSLKDSLKIKDAFNDNDIEDVGTQVILRNRVVLAIYRKIIIITFFSFIVFLASVLTAILFTIKEVPPKYVPLTNEGKIIPYVDLSKPNKDAGGILKFSLDAVADINRYDYVNWKDQFNAFQKYFTPQGWNSYLNQYNESNIINTVKLNRVVVSSELLGNPTIVAEGFSESTNRYMWKIDIPVRINYYESAKERQGVNSQTGIISLTLIRVPVNENSEGVGILRYILDTSTKAQSTIKNNN